MHHPGHAIVTLSCVLILAAPATARATLSSAAYVLPRTVEFLPDRATATQVVLRGAFVNTAGGYTHGTGCGQMHFVCPTGSEALCRQQWEGIAAAIGTTFCQGFGTAAMAAPYTLLRDGTPLARPATWDVAAGVVADDYVEKYCPVARFSECPADLSTWGGPTGGTSAPAPAPAPAPAGCAMGRSRGDGIAGLAVAAALLLRRRRRQTAPTP